MRNIAAVKMCAIVALGVGGVLDMSAQLTPAQATTVASNLFGPRGLKFGPNGNLYVATSGTANAQTGEMSPTVPGGPYFGDASATILKIDRQGNVTTLATGFPSTFNPPTNGGWGVGDVAFLDGELYAVMAGGGPGHGNPNLPNMVAKVDLATGQWTMIADLSAAVRAHPPANMDTGDFQPDGDFYSLISARGKLYTVDPNHGQVWSVTKKGDLEMVTDISKLETSWIGPTALADSDGGLLVSNLGPFPIMPDSSLLMTLRPGCGAGVGYAVDDCGPGTLHIASASLPGLTTVVGMDWGPDGLLYLLELSDPQTATEQPPFFPTPGDGKVVRVRNGVAQDVITGLSVPTGMTFGPDGALYVSNWGAAAAPIGQILRFNIH
jgi:hypothetical protein